VKLVVAGDYVQFLDYCREHGLNPHSRPRTVKFVQSYGDFFGVDNAELVCYGIWEQNPVYQNPELWSFLIEYSRAKHWKMPEGL
jgi:hypothetical protein